MKIHLFVSGLKTGSMDLDKKLPLLIKTYPDGKIEKTSYSEISCIKGTNIAKDIKLIKVFDKKVDSNINIDFYGFSDLCHSYFDISFNIDFSLVEELVQKNFNKAFYMQSDIMIKEKSYSFAFLMTEYILPYYDTKNYIQVEKSLDNDISSLNDNLDIILERTGERPYCSTGVMGGMSVGPHDHFTAIEDFNNEIDINNDSWENIFSKDKVVYLNNQKSILICKNQDYLDKFYEYYFYCWVRPIVFKHIRQICKMYLSVIQKKSKDIKKNIIDDNLNSYYWKELKKNIEVLDLNFLEFHTDMIRMTRIALESMDTEIKKEHINKCSDYSMKIIKNIQSDLNEIKYALSNLSTPSHTHDEAILQKETEKVNDRILMLSFIAMTVSAIGMIQSNEIDTAIKLISGAGIFSLPVIYYVARSFQKKMSLSRNKQNELKRKLHYEIKGLEHAKKERDSLKDDKEIPEDFKKEVMQFMNQFVVATEESVEKMKKKIK